MVNLFIQLSVRCICLCLLIRNNWNIVQGLIVRFSYHVTRCMFGHCDFNLTALAARKLVFTTSIFRAILNPANFLYCFWREIMVD